MRGRLLDFQAIKNNIRVFDKFYELYNIEDDDYIMERFKIGAFSLLLIIIMYIPYQRITANVSGGAIMSIFGIWIYYTRYFAEGFTYNGNMYRIIKELPVSTKSYDRYLVYRFTKLTLINLVICMLVQMYAASNEYGEVSMENILYVFGATFLVPQIINYVNIRFKNLVATIVVGVVALLVALVELSYL